MTEVGELDLDFLFNPRTIAIVGVATDSVEMNYGYKFVESLLHAGFKGKIYPVGVKGGSAFGIRIYPNIRDIPGDIDYVISAIRSQFSLDLIEECALKNVKAIHFFTSGFSELASAEGRRLQSEIVRKAKYYHIRILGPNCMGLYCPRTGLSFAVDYPTQSGPLAFISQSGGKSYQCIREASTRGIYLSKVISYGNAADLNEIDFLKYFVSDNETQIIGAYMEGVADGRHFPGVLKALSRTKPVIIYKGGTTEAGEKTALSHTSSIAGSSKIWESLLRQCGAIQVDSVEEIVDVALLFQCMVVPKGRNAAIIGIGGGSSVQASDEFSKVGIPLPDLSQQTRQRLKDTIKAEAGRIFSNPVDINGYVATDTFRHIVDIVTSDEQINILIVHVCFDSMNLSTASDRKQLIWQQIEWALSLKDIAPKIPCAVVMHSQADDESKLITLEIQHKLREAGLPVYPSFRRAASAIDKFIWYHRWKNSQW